MRIVVLSGRARLTFELPGDRYHRKAYAADLKRFLFPTNGGYFKAKRRGARALAGA